MRLRTVAICVGLLVPPLVALAPRLSPSVSDASAAVSVLVALDELVRRSSCVVVAEALERRAAWQEVAGSRRIVTYTRLRVERAVVGAPGREFWVRTLGGVVGSIGQHVSGEAALALGSRSLVFLTAADGAFVVTALAQGHYPLERDREGELRLRPSPDAGTLLPRRGPTVSARETLVGTTLRDATELVRARRRSDAP